MRWLLAIAALVVCVTVMLGLHQLRASQENQREIQLEGPRGSRLFLAREESQRAASLGILPPQTRSILYIPHKMRYGQFVWNDLPTASGDLTIRVDLKEQLISVFRGGHEIGVAVTLYGTDDYETPTGRFPILAKIEDHRSATYDNAPMPYTLRLTADGVAIHGSKVRRGAATHGCIGVPVEFARKLFGIARVGDVVEISGATVPLKRDPVRNASTIS